MKNMAASAQNLKSGMSTRIISNEELPGIHSNGMFGSVEDMPEMGLEYFENRKTFEFELKEKHSKIEGILYAIASQVSWSLMLPILKLLYKHNPSVMSSEALYFKSISMVFFICIYSNWSTGTFSLSVPKKYRTLIFVRCLTGFVWISTQFISIQYLSIGTATCIIYTSPIITTFLAFFFMNEFISGWDVFALLASFGGVLIINSGGEQQDLAGTRSKSENLYIGTMICMLSALASGCSNTIMRHMRDGIHYTTGPTFFSMACSLFSPFMIFYQLQVKTER